MARDLLAFRPGLGTTGVKRRLGRVQSALAVLDLVVDGWSVLAREALPPPTTAPAPPPPVTPPPVRYPPQPPGRRRMQAPSHRTAPYWIAAAVLAAVGDLLLARLVVHRGVSGALLPALLPALLVVVGVLVESTRVALFYAALALSIVLPVVTTPVAFAGSSIYAADLVAVLALVSWVGARLLGRPVRGSSALALTGIGFPLFVLAVGQAIVRGHISYGLGIVSEPMRLILYASIALTITQVDTRRLYRGVVAVFYVGTVWMLVSAAYYVATGQSQTDQIDVSTGGHRYVSLTVAMYLAA